MFKNILISGLLCTFLGAQSYTEKQIGFNTFLQKAIANSPYLESSGLAIKQAKERGESLTRYENPTLELEYSNFSADVGNSDSGYRVNYSQPIRLWNVGDNKSSLSKEILNSANAEYTQKKAIFISDISVAFTSYSQQKMYQNLGYEELEIAKTIYNISKGRYDLGTISRGLMIQAKIDYETVQINNESLSLSANESYYELLKLAGIREEVAFDILYTFELSGINNNENNPNLELLQSKQKQALSEAKVNSNSVEWMNLFAEYENEPDQDIARVGVNFPLAFFNTKSEEKKIATLQASRSKLLIDNTRQYLDIEMNRLKKQRASLKKLHSQNEEILKTETELLTMFQNAYKIANINLLQLQNIKNKVISTKRSLIQIKTALNKNAIITNYNQGIYND